MIRRAAGYQDDVAGGADFWEVMIARFGLSLELMGGTLSGIPGEGPLVLVANHPFGILDGLAMGHILSRVRSGEFRILAHRIFRRAAELDRIILPISFDASRGAMAANLETRVEALDYLTKGGAIGVFPGGTVSTSARPFSRPLDPVWRTFTAKMIARSGATVVPVFFAGTNSRFFQVASHLHPTLRVALLINEFRRRVDMPVQIVIGAPIGMPEMSAYSGDQKALMDFLRARTYALSPNRLDSGAYGFEFEKRHRRAGADGSRDIR